MHRTLLSCLLILLPLTGQTPGPATDFFERKIRPVLAEKCYSCHATKAKISFAGLQLDTRDVALKVLNPGKPLESKLYQALLYTGQTKMPPTGKLPDATIEDFRLWIEQGATWPADSLTPAPAPSTLPKTTNNHWAWKPVAKPTPPAVQATSWPLDPIDAFILAKLEHNNLRPAPDASRELWFRRVSLDLTGLPPTIPEQDRFLHDASPEAYSKAVDRLLESPAFGERWGRHWLDQTYYADNIEIGRRVPARHAWRYRDYVIDSIQRDIPYNRFLLEQLAGDQLEATTALEQRRNIVATGFLALGPWPLVNADKEQLKMDVVDLQVDMVGRTTLGLTMGCARCHDHKFDPLSQRDYYGMAGIFSSTRTISGRLGLGVFSNVNQTVLPELPEELAARAEETRLYWSKLQAARERLTALRDRRKTLAKDTPEAKALDKEIAAEDQLVKLYEFLPPVPATAHAVQDAETPANCRINVRGNAHQLGDEVARSAVALLSSTPALDIADFTSGRKELAEWIINPANPLTARVHVNRLWHHLFGAGIVSSIDNFGTRGAAPTHPELLDYLATEFIANGWHTKPLLRRIVLSRAYRQSAATNTKALETDPENRLLWRMSRRRLEAETIRDAMLSVSGLLDPKAGGPSLPFYVPGNVNLGKPEFFKEEAVLDTESRNRRSIYLPVLRKSQMPELDILNLFNFPDPNQITGPRTPTTIPTQALYLMNAPFVQQQAEALATRILATGISDEERIALLVRTVYARRIRDGEAQRLLQFLNQGQRQDAWKRLCHSLLISNEFLYRS
ncbi:MAG: PSD1 and planctomycete cytochrome C domain-containing protein [Bryobacteraceae bacterium]